MTEIPKKIKPEQLLEIIIKRHWFIIIPFCISMIIGTVQVITLPRIYESKTVILVQPQKVPSNIVQDIVSSDLNARISTLSQQILSRSNLEKIIEDFHLFSGPKFEKMFLEKKVENLQEKISVKVTQGTGRGADADSFSISFRGTDPEKVMQVTSSLASSFIDENLKIREAQAIGTNTFLEDELETMRTRLMETEQMLKNYRETNMGGLPEQLNSNLSILSNLNERLTSIQTEIIDARSRVTNLRNTDFEPAALQTSRPVETRNTEELSLDQMKDQLEVFKNRYTDSHPDVIRLKKRISDFEIQMKKEGKNKVISSEHNGDRRPRLNQTFILQRQNIRNEISRLEHERDDIIKQIALYKKRVEDTPKREQELQTLQRDYDNINETYNSLLGRQLEAQIAVNMEKKQKGEQFRILDPARLPQSPISPDMKKLFLFVMAAGLGIGGGLIFLLEFMDSSFKDPEDIESFLNLPVLATLPTVTSIFETQRNRKKMIISFAGVSVAGILFVIFLGSMAVMG
ncbi:MAG: XrtA system polysaccharide chain length determinant [Desulfobacteraceae bacterium]|jgi:polysaccharide chain length determinant protein (PEP-CTERM system associated)